MLLAPGTLTAAPGAPSAISSAVVYFSPPFMAARTAIPGNLGIALAGIVLRCMQIRIKIPFCSNLWSLCRKGVMLTHSPPSTVWAATANGSVSNSCLPYMCMPIRAILAGPLHLGIRHWIDDFVANANICNCIPLLLQMRRKLADIWAPVLWLLLGAGLT